MKRKNVSSKKIKVGKIDDENSDNDFPNKFQTVKGIQYLRPLHFAATPNGTMEWVPDVDNYPDSK